MAALRDAFHDVLRRHGAEDEAIEAFWHEAERAHSTRVRHYHTLAHLEDLHAKLGPLRGQLLDPDAVTLAIVYHDIVYRVSRKDNEERSAELMRERLAPLGVPSPLIGRVQAHILATKAHVPGHNPDTDFFTDADLGILGAEAERYRLYARQVRREYRRYPDFLYNPGRRKVLARFLAMPRIFKTGVFHERYEAQARRNIADEMASLGGRADRSLR